MFTPAPVAQETRETPSPARNARLHSRPVQLLKIGMRPSWQLPSIRQPFFVISVSLMDVVEAAEERLGMFVRRARGHRSRQRPAGCSESCRDFDRMSVLMLAGLRNQKSRQISHLEDFLFESFAGIHDWESIGKHEKVTSSSLQERPDYRNSVSVRSHRPGEFRRRLPDLRAACSSTAATLRCG